MNCSVRELQDLETRLAEKRDELARLNRECRLLRGERDRLIRSLEGQLDLFRQQLDHTDQVTGEVAHA
ncbi:MAG: hypothetical protein VX796_08385 [Pseudomonadota bacterium]|jgi:hypothetical protein|uniref:hypothetical protein n=1 Tax=Salinicola sp. TaxID=1978524 RepID=UPI001DC1AF1E|nr:hypothetical protein [Salinicola sp.]MEC8917621.1 hypothetical protein [Pseudomonadota bacterium]MED5501279.1 hypothetical protein [Pseudomonadota bacterium]NRB55867.1 hypothetical protein [Salinicola sp.]